MSFDTEEQAFEAAQEYERAARSRRYSSLSHQDSWRYASMLLKSSTLTTYGPEASCFAYPEDDSIIFDELLPDVPAEEHPEIAPVLKEGYLEGNVYWVLWKLSERLVASSVFDHRSLASPFYVGCQLQAEVLVVLRILNWPTGSRWPYALSEAYVVGISWSVASCSCTAARDKQGNPMEASVRAPFFQERVRVTNEILVLLVYKRDDDGYS